MPGADRAAGKLLGCGGETVEEIAADQEEVHQHGVGGERQRAELRALPREQRECAQAARTSGS